MNVIALHQNTPYYSAQGLGHAFAAMVEATVKHHACLAIFESTDEMLDASMNEVQTLDHSNAGEVRRQEAQGEDPWMAELQIANSSIKTVGSVDMRAWTGRKTKAKAIARRWCLFKDLPKT